MGITRFAETTWSGDLVSGSGSINYVSSGSIDTAAGHLGIAHRGAQRSHQPRGADRRGACRLLLDGLQRQARQERHAGDEARHQVRRVVRQGRRGLGDQQERVDRSRHGAGDRPGQRSRSSPTRPRTAARCRRPSRGTSRSPWRPRSRAERRARAGVPGPRSRRQVRRSRPPGRGSAQPAPGAGRRSGSPPRARRFAGRRRDGGRRAFARRSSPRSRPLIRRSPHRAR